MSHHIAWTLAAVTAGGGIYAGIVRNSRPSLAAGVVIGTAYAASGYLIQNNKDNGVELATATSGLLFGAMAPRALRLRAPAPIVLATAGLIGTAYYGKKLYEQEYGV
ncbi:hypothetical protein HDV03_003614 [Kappamyces sp. JEL0829]|nr:hypothetical protein HDV03_003614 [Kappamyces sp. JEL0829]